MTVDRAGSAAVSRVSAGLLAESGADSGGCEDGPGEVVLIELRLTHGEIRRLRHEFRLVWRTGALRQLPGPPILERVIRTIGRMSASGHISGHLQSGWLTLAELERVFQGVTARTLRRWCRSGRFPGARQVRGWIVPIEAAEQLRREQEDARCEFLR